MAVVFVVVLALWGVANLVFAFVDPPRALERFMPTKVWVFFALLPTPWDRRMGMMFNAGIALVGTFFYARHVL